MVKSESARPTGQVIPHCRPFETIALGSLVVYWPDLMFESYRDPILSKQKCLWSLEIASDHKLADGFDKSLHDQLMTVNLIRTLAWTVCGICAVWIVLSTWAADRAS